MNLYASEFSILENAASWGRALWFAASVFGSLFIVAVAGLTAEIASAWSKPQRAPGAEFMGVGADLKRRV